MKGLTSLFPAAMAVAVIYAAAVPPSAYAVLGGIPETSGAPAQTSRTDAVVRADTDAPFTVSESELAGGTSVHEYVSRNDIVFAVTWSGPQIPDLRTLLGARFDSYVGAIAQHRAAGDTHGAVTVSSADMVVHSAGHMGAFAGLAYLPAQLPPGVTHTDLH